MALDTVPNDVLLQVWIHINKPDAWVIDMRTLSQPERGHSVAREMVHGTLLFRKLQYRV